MFTVTEYGIVAGRYSIPIALAHHPWLANFGTRSRRYALVSPSSTAWLSRAPANSHLAASVWGGESVEVFLDLVQNDVGEARACVAEMVA
jgi:hypothetical protein